MSMSFLILHLFRVMYKNNYNLITKETKTEIYDLMVDEKSKLDLRKGYKMTNLLGVPLAMLTRFFNKEICIEIIKQNQCVIYTNQC